MTGGPERNSIEPGGGSPPPVVSPSQRSLVWLMAIRLVVTTTLFIGALIIQAATRMILPLGGLYLLVVLTYGLSLGYLVLYAARLSYRFQAVVQLVGDIVIVTGFVYVTGGILSPFSFLYLTVIVVAAVTLRGGGLIFAGLSAVAYGFLVDLMVFRVIPVPANLVGERFVLPSSRIIYQLLIHVVGFVLVAALVSYLVESLRATYTRLDEQQQRATQYAALAHHVVQSVGSGILATDPDGRVLHLNPAGARILGITDLAAAVGRPVASVMPLGGLSWPELLARGDRSAGLRHEGTLEGSGVRLGLGIGPLSDDAGRQVGFVVNFQDLSEVERIKRRERLRDRMAALGEMTVRVAHEIKNPLASISGSAQMLAGQDGVDGTARRLLGIIVDESSRLSRIIDEFLNSARPHQLRKRPVDVAAILEDHVALLRRSPELGPDHDIRLSVPGPISILADENLLHQIFWNLSRNALQAMPEGGRLEISVLRRGGTAVLRWSDTGEGMDEELRSRAFEPFVTTRSSGTGLGLAVVYTLVDEHDGSVDIESRPGEGTTVTIALPCTGEDA